MNIVTDLVVKAKEADPEFDTTTLELDEKFWVEASESLSVDALKQVAEAISSDAEIIAGCYKQFYQRKIYVY